MVSWKPGKAGGVDRVWHEVNRRVQGMDDDIVRVGVLASKGGSETVEGGDFTLVDLANAHEFGIPGRLEERSFIRRTFIEKSRELGQFIAKLVGPVMLGRLPKLRALEFVGAFAAGLVKKLIVSGSITPDILESTKQRKGSSKPLLDTGQLMNAIVFEVVPA